MPTKTQTKVIAPTRTNPLISLGMPLDSNMHKDTQSAIISAGLDWKIELRPTYSKYQGKRLKIPNVLSVVKEEEGQDPVVLGSVGSRYVVLQNRDAFTHLDRLFTNKDLSFEAAGPLVGGTRVYILARLGRGIKIAEGDVIDPYVLLHTSHNGAYAVSMRFLAYRRLTQTNMTVGNQEFKFRHTPNMQDKMDGAGRALKAIVTDEGQMIRVFEQFAQTKAKDSLVNEVVDILSPDRSKESSELVRTRSQTERLALWNLLESSSTVSKDTFWGLYCLASEWIDWAEPRKGMSVPDAPGTLERRVLYSMEGQGSITRNKVFDLLVSKL